MGHGLVPKQIVLQCAIALLYFEAVIGDGKGPEVAFL